MITLAFYFGGMILGIIGSAMSIVTFTIPIQFTNAVLWFTSYLQVLKGIIDLPNLFLVIITYINFCIAFYSIKIIWWVMRMLPVIGVHIDKHPTIRETTSVSQTENGIRTFSTSTTKSRRE